MNGDLLHHHSLIGIIAALFFLGGCQTTSATKKIPLSPNLMLTMHECTNPGASCSLAVSVDGGTYETTLSSGENPDKTSRSLIEQCQHRSGKTCVLLVEDGSYVSHRMLAMLTEEEQTSGEWYSCLINIEEWRAMIRERSETMFIPGYLARHACEDGDSKILSVTIIRNIKEAREEGLDRDSNSRLTKPDVYRPSLKNKPDRDLCKSLVYKNPDYIKEAKRRSLTDAKCREILGN